MPGSDQLKMTPVAPAGTSRDQAVGEGVAKRESATHDLAMDEDHIGKAQLEIAKLTAVFEGFRAVPQMVLTALAITMGTLSLIVAVAIFVLNSVNTQLRDVGAKVDAIPKLLSDEFRAMRAETAAQTSAIAASITAA